MALKHVLLKNPRLQGWQYGMLRALEDEIVSQTGATVIDVPEYGLQPVLKRMGHQMRWDAARTLFPKKSFLVDADVIWYILMGAENYELDLFKDWFKQAKQRIVYLFDTLEVQFDLTQKLFSDDMFNIRITSFEDAVQHLQTITGKKWYAIEQAVPASLFHTVPEQEKLIDFSSYGRRYPAFHSALLEFCRSNNLFYDYTTHDGNHPAAPAEELYCQYAWHLRHSIFTISWPVEMTHPKRAGRLKPITCRWFEAGSAGTIIVGRQPGNEFFNSLLYPGLVIEINPFAEKRLLWKQMEKIYSERSGLLENARRIAELNKDRWTWVERVNRMLTLVTNG
ncbi:MAG: hypothetical protein ABIN89_24090 [Chitinophagaceae bacterium]